MRTYSGGDGAAPYPPQSEYVLPSSKHSSNLAKCPPDSADILLFMDNPVFLHCIKQNGRCQTGFRMDMPHAHGKKSILFE